MLALYWLGAQIGFTFANKGILTPVWPPAAVGAAAAILFGPRSLVLVAGYIALSYARKHPELAQWSWIEPLALLVAALLVRSLARRLDFDPRIGTLGAVLGLLAIGAIYSAGYGLTVTAGYCGLASNTHCENTGPLVYFGESLLGDFFGALVCLPAMLGWLSNSFLIGARARPRLPRPSRAHWRFLAVALPSAVLAWVVTRASNLPVDVVGFLVMPLLVWAALQFQSRFVHSVIMVTGLVAISLQLGAGRVDFQGPTQHLVSLLVFLLSMSMLTLIVHVVAHQKEARAGEQATQIEKARIDLMLQSATEAVISFDSRARITYLNPAAERLFGSGVATIGAQLTDFLPDPRLQALLRLDHGASDRHRDRLLEGRAGEVVVGDAAGAPRALEVALTSYRTEGEWQATAFLHDVTERRRAEQEIRAGLARQEELNKLRSQFIAVTSHEFRTPLATIQSSAEILDRYSDRLPASEKRDLLGSIGKSVERMTRMIERVLFIGRSDAELLDYAPHDLDLVRLCREVAAETLQEWPESTVAIEQEYPPELPGRFDDRLLRHALGNLLSNAIKYSQGAAQPVRLAAQRVNGAVTITVEDHGIGIPSGDLPHLFEAFQRGGNVGSIPGTGLGLSIVRRAVDLHGGRIEVDSTPGRGTRFTIVI